MGTISSPDIWDILEKAGYDCDKLSNDQWEDYNQEFENECEEFLKQAVEEKKKIIVMEWSSRLNLKRVKGAK